MSSLAEYSMPKSYQSNWPFGSTLVKYFVKKSWNKQAMSGDSCIDHSIIIDVLYGIPDLHLCFMNASTFSSDF